MKEQDVTSPGADDLPEGISRRDLMIKGGTLAAAVWAAPAITRLPGSYARGTDEAVTPGGASFDGFVDGFRVIAWETPGPNNTLEVVGSAITIDYLLVGGGGGGGGRAYAGGGGAGGVVEGTGLPLSPGTYNLTVGTGGEGSPDETGAAGSQGGQTIAFELSAAEGGGGGGGGAASGPEEPTAGGSGGGGGGTSSVTVAGATAGTQGTAGGSGFPDSTVGNRAGGGGGGQGGPGQPGTSGTGGNGGPGIDRTGTFGTDVGASGRFAGGGGGSADGRVTGTTQGTGFDGGGSAGSAGTNGTGGGGGAATNVTGGFRGGDGAIVIRIALD